MGQKYMSQRQKKCCEGHNFQSDKHMCVTLQKSVVVWFQPPMSGMAKYTSLHHHHHQRPCCFKNTLTVRFWSSKLGAGACTSSFCFFESFPPEKERKKEKKHEQETFLVGFKPDLSLVWQTPAEKKRQACSSLIFRMMSEMSKGIERRQMKVPPQLIMPELRPDISCGSTCLLELHYRFASGEVMSLS